MKHHLRISCILAICLALFTASPALAANGELMMATTTSTDNTGLLDYLMPHCTRATGIPVKWTATGTGKAL
ncbi:MAG: tungsten ABC transporter substrate-binding protein, partial [Desulfobacterales bacterium]|nr:tungsten ABC transporter substrate-binding protein [Desulfobacterales bacterium]